MISRNGVQKKLFLGAALLAFGLTAQAQEGQSQNNAQPPRVFYVPKPIKPTQYTAPMKPLVRLQELIDKHKGQANWSELVVLDHNNRATVDSAAPGTKVPLQLHSDAPVYWAVLKGTISFQIEGPTGEMKTYTASKGDLVLAPERRLFSLESTGSEPSIRLTVTLPDTSSVYAVKPDKPEPGMEYEPVTLSIGNNPDEVPGNGKPEQLYFNIDELQKEHGGAKTWSVLAVKKNRAHANIICGDAATVKHIEGNLGHYHTDFAEIWTILRGQQSLTIEGQKPFVMSEGDIAYAPARLWHLPEAAGQGMSCRLAMTPYPAGNHLFQPGARRGGD